MINDNQLGSNLIFMIGLPRSGTTFLQRILDKHPDIHTVPEPWIMLHPIYALKRGGVSAEFDSFLARQALDDFLVTIPGGEQGYIEALRTMGSSLYEKALQGSGKKYFLDKTPRYYFIATELLRVFPESKFVFIFRNPLSILSSILETWFDNHIELMRSHYFLDLMKGPRLMLDAIQKFQGRAHVVQYEALVKNPKPIISDLCKYLNIPFIENIIEYRASTDSREAVGNNQPIENKWAGKFGDQKGVFQYNKPVTDSLDKWIANLSSSAELLGFAQEYLDTLGASIIGEMGYNPDELNGILQESRHKFSEEQVGRIGKFGWNDWQKTDEEKFIAQLQSKIKWHEIHNASEKQYYEEVIASQQQQIGQQEQTIASQQQQIGQHEQTIASQQQQIGDLAELIKVMRNNRIYRFLRSLGRWSLLDQRFDELVNKSSRNPYKEEQTP